MRRITDLRSIVLLAAIGATLLGPIDASASTQAAPANQPDADNRTRLDAQGLFVRGMTQSYLEDYQEAISLFERALDLAPREPSILLALADAEAARDNFDTALYYARQATQYADNEPYYYLRQAELEQEAGHADDALSTYQDLVSRFPQSLDGVLGLARLQRDLERPEAALHTYQTLLEGHPDAPAEVYREVLPLFRQVGDTARIESTLKTLTDRYPDTPRYQRLLGQLYLDQGRSEAALPLYEKLAREHPRDSEILRRLQQLYTDAGRTADAQEISERLGAADSSSPAQLFSQVRSLLQEASTSAPPDSARLHGAEEQLRIVLDRSPTRVDAMDLLGRVYVLQERYQEAGRILESALDENPRDPSRWARAASAYHRAGYPQSAASLAEEGLLLFPGQYRLARTAALARLQLRDDAAAQTHLREALSQVGDADRPASERARLHAARGFVHSRLGRPQDADAAFEEALSIASSEPMVLTLAARGLAVREEQLDRALELAQRSVEREPSRPESLGTLGYVYAQRGNLQEARAHLQNAVDTGSAMPWVYEQLGHVHDALGNPEQAQQYWRRALERAPDWDVLRKKVNANTSS